MILNPSTSTRAPCKSSKEIRLGNGHPFDPEGLLEADVVVDGDNFGDGLLENSKHRPFIKLLAQRRWCCVTGRAHTDKERVKVLMDRARRAEAECFLRGEKIA